MIISETLDNNRLKISPNIESNKKSELGQYFTPATVARFMSSLFKDPSEDSIKLLDAGAGLRSGINTEGQ